MKSSLLICHTCAGTCTVDAVMEAIPKVDTDMCDKANYFIRCPNRIIGYNLMHYLSFKLF